MPDLTHDVRRSITDQRRGGRVDLAGLPARHLARSRDDSAGGAQSTLLSLTGIFLPNFQYGTRNFAPLQLSAHIAPITVGFVNSTLRSGLADVSPTLTRLREL